MDDFYLGGYGVNTEVNGVGYGQIWMGMERDMDWRFGGILITREYYKSAVCFVLYHTS